MPAATPILIRTATPADLPALLALDPLAAIDPARARLITDAVNTGTCFVATARLSSPKSHAPDAPPVAFAVYQHRFFGHAFIELVYTHPANRRHGIAAALITHCERHACQTPKLFTSTDQSNAPMRALLAKLDFTPTGRIDSLDEGDPELIYVKRVVIPEGRPPLSPFSSGDRTRSPTAIPPGRLPAPPQEDGPE